jgi:hypothetical protein
MPFKSNENILSKVVHLQYIYVHRFPLFTHKHLNSGITFQGYFVTKVSLYIRNLRYILRLLLPMKSMLRKKCSGLVKYIVNDPKSRD